MAEHPIEGLMLTAMNSIKDMIDVNTIIGDPIYASENIVVIPISKVSFGFAAGGSEFNGETVDSYKRQEKDEQVQYRLPFGGGAGAGVSLNPVAFLVIQGNVVKLLPVDHATSLDKLLDYIPDLFEKVACMANKNMQNKKEQTDKIISAFQKRCEKKDKEKEKKTEQMDELNQEIDLNSEQKNENKQEIKQNIEPAVELKKEIIIEDEN